MKWSKIGTLQLWLAFLHVRLSFFGIIENLFLYLNIHINTLIKYHDTFLPERFLSLGTSFTNCPFLVFKPIDETSFDFDENGCTAIRTSSIGPPTRLFMYGSSLRNLIPAPNSKLWFGRIFALNIICVQTFYIQNLYLPCRNNKITGWCHKPNLLMLCKWLEHQN